MGGNIGLGTIALAALFPGAEFIGVEPDRRYVALRNLNIELNALEARVVEAAATPRDGLERLLFGNNPTCSTLESVRQQRMTEGMVVPTISVASLMRQAGWTGIDLLKNDVEGEDSLLLQKNYFLSRVEAIVVEVYPNTSPERIQFHIAPFGFALRRHGDGARVRLSGDEGFVGLMRGHGRSWDRKRRPARRRRREY